MGWGARGAEGCLEGKVAASTGHIAAPLVAQVAQLPGRHQHKVVEGGAPQDAHRVPPHQVPARQHLQHAGFACAYAVAKASSSSRQDGTSGRGITPSGAACTALRTARAIQKPDRTVASVFIPLHGGSDCRELWALKAVSLLPVAPPRLARSDKDTFAAQLKDIHDFLTFTSINSAMWLAILVGGEHSVASQPPAVLRSCPLSPLISRPGNALRVSAEI